MNNENVYGFIIQMELLLDKLLVLLAGETEVLRCLLSVMQKEKGVMVESDLDGLNTLSKEKEILLLKIRIFEEQRLKIIKSLADFTGNESEKLTLNKLAQIVKEPYSSRFENEHSRFSSLLQTIQEVNQGNMYLMNHSLGVVRSSLKLIGNLMTPNPVYYDTGMIRTKSQNARVCSVKI